MKPVGVLSTRREIDSRSAATETLLFAIRVSRFGFVRQVRVHNPIAHSVLIGGVDDRAP